MIKVFKFGGASVKDAESIINTARIISLYPDEKIAVIVSAMGKTTNTLEVLLNSYMEKKDDCAEILLQIKKYHLDIMKQLFSDAADPVYKEVDTVFLQMEQQLQETPSDSYDYEYDQIVCMGELMSTLIVSAYLNRNNIKNKWLDARTILRTDNTYRDAKILWTETTSHSQKHIDFSRERIYLTQGFIASTKENLSTTLGREGSDYSAAIIAYCMDAKDVTIWKDVPGVLNADPKRFKDTVKIDELTYYDAIELAYYGASVIHPKTIKPLQNKNIPLYVKSFLNPSAEGTIVKDGLNPKLIPSFIFKINQVLITISPKDFSFIVEENLRDIFQIFSDLRVKINVMQNTAISFSVSADNDQRKIKKLIAALEINFKVKYNTELELITIRHYDQPTVDRVSAGKEILLEEKSRHNIQLLVRTVS